jgi:hypothetical protein
LALFVTKILQQKTETAAGKRSWTVATRKKLHAFVHRHDADPVDACTVLPQPEAWQRLVEQATAVAKPCASLEAIVRQAASELKAATPPAFDAEVELVRAALVLPLAVGSSWSEWDEWATERLLIQDWVARGGMRAALELLFVRPGFFWIETIGNDDGENKWLEVALQDQSPSCFAEEQPPFDLADNNPRQHGLASALRCLVDTLSDADFVAANEAAHDVRTALPKTAHWKRAAIAFAFARDPRHARDELAVAWPSDINLSEAACLVLLASPSVADADAILSQCLLFGAATFTRVAYDVVERFGAGAKPILETAVGAAKAAKIPAAQRKYRLAPIEGALGLIG